MNNSPFCPTNLISDIPDSKDYFGSHERIASAIAELIKSEQGGRSIALEGEWGSGKTTVVNILRTKLQGDENITLIPFDAWAHEKDPLRRVFLETIIRHLQELKWIDASKWNIRLDELGHRREVRRTKTIPHLTRFGRIFGLSVFIIPLGLLLTNSALQQNITIDPRLHPAWKFILELIFGLALTFAPIFILAVKWLIKSTSQVDEDVARGWALLFNKAITEESTETIKTADPTSIEFEDIFKELMSEALLHPARRAVLVLDNLDRVDPNDALSIWSTLQTFLRHTYYETPVWFAKLWVLILYDPRGIRLLWDKDLYPSDINSSFLDKSFQVRFKVSHPTLSYWHSYLIERLHEALPLHTPAEFHAVYQVLSLSTYATFKWKTIRGLKLFVNQIGALHRQWSDIFPLAHIAYYVLISDSKEGNDQWLLSSDFPEEKLRGVLAADSDLGLSKLKDSLAALYFNVEVNLARQLLLNKPITTALFSEEEVAPNLREIANKHEGFWQVLERVLADDPFQDRGELIATAAHSLHRSGLLDVTKESETYNVKQEFCKAALRPSIDWSKFETSTSIEGLCLLIRWRNDSHFTRTILGAILSRIKIDITKETFPTRSFAKTLNKLSAELTLISHHEYFVESMIDPLTDRIRTADALSHREFIHLLELLWELHKVDSFAEKAIIELIEDGHLLRHFDGIDGQILIKDAQKAKIARKMREQVVYSSIEATALALYIYLHFSQSSFDLSEIEKAIDGATSKNYGLLYDILTNEEDLYGCVSGFINHLLDNHELQLLIKMLEAMPSSQPFVGSCLRSLPVETFKGLNLLPDQFLKLWRTLREETNKSETGGFYNLTHMLVQDGLIDHLCNNSRNLFNPYDIGLYIVIDKVSENYRTPFGKWLKAGLTCISKKDWDNLLKDKANAPTITALINEINRFRIKPNIDYLDAVIDYASSVASGKIVAEISGNKLIGPLEAKDRKKARRGLFNIAIRFGRDLPDNFLELFGNEMFDQVILNEQSGLISHLLIPLLEEYTLTKLSWLYSLLKSVPNVFDSHLTTDVERLKNKVIEIINKDYQILPTKLTEAIVDFLDINRSELEPSTYREVILFGPEDDSKSRHLLRRTLTEEEEYEGMSNVIERMAMNFIVGLIATPDGFRLMCSGAGNGEINYFEAPRIIELLRLKGLIKISNMPRSGVYIELYELTENGRKLYEEVESIDDKNRKSTIMSRLRKIPYMDGG